ncbi:MAG TPA: hypothetical protein VNZ03_32640 [Terriglobales bacterium]|jgi:hypothetical protein|nr:hypothetical protein [Terriglobales bacterium]
MTRKSKMVFWLITVLCTGAAFSQVPIPGNRTGTRAQANKSPVAYVYVNVTAGNQPQIWGFAADSSGGLTGIPGSPFPGFADVGYWAGKNGYLFGTEGTTDATYIYSYSVSSIGVPSKVAKIKAAGEYAGISGLFLDRTAEDLYDYEEDFGSNNYYQSFRIDRSTGRLTHLGAYNVGYDSGPGGKMTFAGDNLYAYTAFNFCYGDCQWGILGARRNSKGKLTGASRAGGDPPIPKDGDAYLSVYAGADPTDHVAIAVQPFNQFGNDGLPQLATYTVHSDGSLTTESAYWNMPTTASLAVNDIEISPSGKLLAVAGTAGLEVFHFNGSNPMTPYTGLVTNDEIDQCLWDNANHLYAISSKSNLLFVFTVTPTSYRQATGSPYAIYQGPGTQLIVLPIR